MLQTQGLKPKNPETWQFQALIGMLQTVGFFNLGVLVILFQALIGMLQTRAAIQPTHPQARFKPL